MHHLSLLSSWRMGPISPSPAPPSNSGGLKYRHLCLPPCLESDFSVLVYHSLSRLSWPRPLRIYAIAFRGAHVSTCYVLGFWFEDILKTWPGACFSKTPETFRAYKAIAKSLTYNYRAVLNINRDSLHTRSFSHISRIHFFVFTDKLK